MEQKIDRPLERGELVDMIRRMAPGDKITFPLSKIDSVRNVAYNRLLVEKSDGAQWTVIADLANKATIIERVS